MYHRTRKYLLEAEPHRLNLGQFRPEVVERKHHCPFGIKRGFTCFFR
jgi:hypothetical protein